MDDELPGWDAIDDALRKVYGDTAPAHYAPMRKWSLGGDDPLDGISAFRSERGQPHWHIVSYGLTELYAKELEDATTSGYGIELTIRVARRPEETTPPGWALGLLQNLARYVFETGNVFAAGHNMDLQGPICLDAATDVTAVLFAEDPELPAMDTKHGKVAFLQIVGVTQDELETVAGWRAMRFLEVLGEKIPMWITDIGRKSILADPKTAELVERRAEQEGSSMGVLYVDVLGFAKKGFVTTSLEITLGALSIASVRRMMRRRLLFGEPLTLLGPDSRIVFTPGDSASWKTDGEGVLVSVTDALANAIAANLEPRAGRYTFPLLPNVTIQVAKTEIKDGNGKVVRVVG